MDFESPDVMKDFPGLYASEASKNSNDDASDDGDKLPKIGKKKDKKDKKDKERGYAALEGESSAEENADSRSPSKSKKTKSFKFTSKSKDKREKSRDKEKEVCDKKKDKEKKCEKKNEKNKSEKKDRKVKQTTEDCGISLEALPVFGVSLETAMKRSPCHDGVEIPLPARMCIDYVQTHGLLMEGVYKVSGTKSKVMHLRKLFNHRAHVNLDEYDVPTVTSLLKMFLRSLPEALFTNDLLVRFEEAGAIVNAGTREKYLRILTDSLPSSNKLLLAWLFIHFHNIELNEKINKMNKHHLAAALSPALHTSIRLFLVLLYHSTSLFPAVELHIYVPPLTSSVELPNDLEGIEIELNKQESLLSQIHSEMNDGFISKEREELLWEVQRIITQLKRKLKIAQKEAVVERPKEEIIEECADKIEEIVEEIPEEVEEEVTEEHVPEEEKFTPLDKELLFAKLKNSELQKLKEALEVEIETEKKEIKILKSQLQEPEQQLPAFTKNCLSTIDEIISLLRKENQILEIKKINLVRQVMEQYENCIEIKARTQLNVLCNLYVKDEE